VFRIPPGRGTFEETFVIQFRTFRNDDPPRLVRFWNETFTGRGTYYLRTPTPLERHVFAKTWFDREGLIVASEDDRIVGMIHCGFGPNESQNDLSFNPGLICVLAVHPDFRKRKIGTELLQRAEAYFRTKGTSTIIIGSTPLRNPFYLGLYGGSNSPGILRSDSGATPFPKAFGYEEEKTVYVFQRRLELPLNIPDPRFGPFKRRFDFEVSSRHGIGTWWFESVWNLIELSDFRLIDRSSGMVVASARMWEMDGFSWRWGVPSSGIVNVEVRPELRRQGIGKYLMVQLVRHLQDNYYGIAEVQIPDSHPIANTMFKNLGFELVDVGQSYTKSLS
jgi:ribosomal protein S18 acetylase RimI-like enzyme